MADRFDVVIVGARCAGAALGTLLAGQGVKVAVIEQATFPRDTLSSHVFEADAVAFLDRLGLTGRLRASGAPVVNRADIRVEDCRFSIPWPQAPGDVGGMMSVRRHVLDPILAGAAADAGAEVRMGTRVAQVREDSGRVAGVRVRSAGREHELRARLVVGADGRNSTIATLCRARKYNVVANQRALYWSYFEHADTGSEPAFLTHRWADRFVLAIPADAGLYQVLAWPEISALERSGRQAAYHEQIRSCELLTDTLAGARQAGKLYGASRWQGFFREASGPGWVLLGDAGHFKDPAPGRGIADAFLQAVALAAAITAGLGRPDTHLDRAMAQWGRWRDREFAAHYWLANDLGQSGPVPAVLTEIVRRLNEQGQAGIFLELLNHRAKPSQVLTASRLMAATGRLMARPRGQRRTVLHETAGLVASDARRRWRSRRPRYVPDGTDAAPRARKPGTHPSRNLHQAPAGLR
jgi:2-polyprenyl-6-methoxyphenol hydroxylase-like FAD-dependent oxidoreductase